MKVYTTAPARGPARSEALLPPSRGDRLRRCLQLRGEARPVPAARARGREHDDAAARHRDRHRLRAQPDEPGERRARAADDQQRALHPRARFAGAPAHPEPLQHAVVEARGAHARDGARGEGDLRALGRAGRTRLPGRVLPPHVDDPRLRPGAERVRSAAGLQRRLRPAHDRRRGRGGRRLLRAPVQHPRVAAPERVAGAREGAREGPTASAPTST